MKANRGRSIHRRRRRKATHIGYRAYQWTQSGPAVTRVDSVFDRACNLETPDGRLIALLAPVRPGPASIVVPGLEAALDRVERGQRVTINVGAIEAPAAGLLIDLASAVVWKRISPPDRPLPAAPTCIAAARTAMRVALERPGAAGLVRLLPELVEGTEPNPPSLGDSLEAGMLREARAAIHRLGMALTAMVSPRSAEAVGRGDPTGRPYHAPDAIDLEAALAPAGRLIGLGPGLTPSGDDFLTGLILALNYAAGAPGNELAGIPAFGRGVAELAPGRTTWVSAEQLRYAAGAEAEEAIAEAAIALLWATDQLRPAVEALLDTGSSSGGDLLTGICAASVWLNLDWSPCGAA